jgi:hypothetical protein
MRLIFVDVASPAPRNPPAMILITAPDRPPSTRSSEAMPIVESFHFK